MNKILIAILALSIWGCKKSASDTSYSVDSTAEAGQQVGDAMASIDESGGTTNGTVAELNMKASERAFARLSPNEISISHALFSSLLANAEATSCSAATFDTCGNSGADKLIRSFNGCSTFAGGAMSGDVTLSFSGTDANNCRIPAVNDAVSRIPNYSISGLRGATFSVSATSSGQTLTRTAAGGSPAFDFTNSGIRRTFVTPNGSTFLDLTTTTGTAIHISGDSRATRLVNGGSLIVTNNLSGISCTLTPSSVQWTAGCNCPTSGSWVGTCTDSTNLSVAFGSTCGAATVTKGSSSSDIVMDRCQ